MSLPSAFKLAFVEYNLVPFWVLKRRQEAELLSWQSSQAGHFPHILKQQVVLDSARAAGTRIFVETGTYYGLMLQACLPHFNLLYSIELEPHFYKRARRVFRGCPKVKLLNGDSAELLPQALASIAEPALFWLDAHYSGGLTGHAAVDTPIWKELEAVFAHPSRHVILIDDAHCFDGTHGYPTLEQIASFANRHAYAFSLNGNIIHLR
jgi:hypothetical protein